MNVFRSRAELGAWLEQDAGVVGFVPTMGALHEGHLSLIRRARDLSERVVMSIFVNPLQFGPSEDFDAYPRDEAKDLALAREEKVDAVFIPPLEEIYPPGDSTRVSVGPIGDILEGASRPDHFDGVATVVAKLFNIVRPNLAFFGQKDAQQVAVIRQMVAGLRFPIEIIVCPTVREPDGLALSSRNAYLSPEERARAVVLWRSLENARTTLEATGDPAQAARVGRETVESAEEVQLDYFEAVHPLDLQPARRGEVLFLVAARVGKTRLIDNLQAGSEADAIGDARTRKES